MQTIVDDFVKNTEYRQKAQTVNVSLHDDCDMSVQPAILFMQMT